MSQKNNIIQIILILIIIPIAANAQNEAGYTLNPDGSAYWASPIANITVDKFKTSEITNQHYNQTIDLNWNGPTTNINIAFKFEKPVTGHIQIAQYTTLPNGTQTYTFTDRTNLLEHEQYGTDHYYKIINIPVTNRTHKKALLSIDQENLQPGEELKYDFLGWYTADTIQTAKTTGRYIALDPIIYAQNLDTSYTRCWNGTSYVAFTSMCTKTWDNSWAAATNCWLEKDTEAPKGTDWMQIDLNQTYTIGALNITNGLSGYETSNLDIYFSTDNITWTLNQRVQFPQEQPTSSLNISNEATGLGEAKYIRFNATNSSAVFGAVGLCEIEIYKWEALPSGQGQVNIQTTLTDKYDNSSILTYNVTATNGTTTITNTTTTGTANLAGLLNKTNYTITATAINYTQTTLIANVTDNILYKLNASPSWQIKNITTTTTYTELAAPLNITLTCDTPDIIHTRIKNVTYNITNLNHTSLYNIQTPQTTTKYTINNTDYGDTLNYTCQICSAWQCNTSTHTIIGPGIDSYVTITAYNNLGQIPSAVLISVPDLAVYNALSNPYSKLLSTILQGQHNRTITATAENYLVGTSGTTTANVNELNTTINITLQTNQLIIYFLQDEYLNQTNYTVTDTGGNRTNYTGNTATINQEEYQEGKIIIQFNKNSSGEWSQSYEYENDFGTNLTEYMNILHNQDWYIYLYVKDEMGNPISGATVRALENKVEYTGYGNYRLIQQKITSNEGKVGFYADKETTIFLQVIKEGYTLFSDVRQAQEYSSSSANPEGITLTRQANTIYMGRYATCYPPDYTNLTSNITCWLVLPGETGALPSFQTQYMATRITFSCNTQNTCNFTMYNQSQFYTATPATIQVALYVDNTYYRTVQIPYRAYTPTSILSAKTLQDLDGPLLRFLELLALLIIVILARTMLSSPSAGQTMRTL